MLGRPTHPGTASPRFRRSQIRPRGLAINPPKTAHASTDTTPDPAVQHALAGSLSEATAAYAMQHDAHTRRGWDEYDRIHLSTQAYSTASTEAGGPRARHRIRSFVSLVRSDPDLDRADVLHLVPMASLSQPFDVFPRALTPSSNPPRSRSRPQSLPSLALRPSLHRPVLTPQPPLPTLVYVCATRVRCARTATLSRPPSHAREQAGG